MKNLNEVPTMELAKELISRLIKSHEGVICEKPDHAAVHVDLWVHNLPLLDEPLLEVSFINHETDKFTNIAVDWSEFNELSAKRDVQV